MSYIPLVFFIGLLIVNVIFLSVYIRDYKLIGFWRNVSWVELFYSIIFLTTIFIWLIGPSIPVFIKNTFSATVSRQTAIELIDECKVAGVGRDDTRTRVYLKENQNFVYAPLNDYDALTDAYRKAPKSCR